MIIPKQVLNSACGRQGQVTFLELKCRNWGEIWNTYLPVQLNGSFEKIDFFVIKVL